MNLHNRVVSALPVSIGKIRCQNQMELALPAGQGSVIADAVLETTLLMSVAILDGALSFEMAQLGACAIWMTTGTVCQRIRRCRRIVDADNRVR
ncbi:hypothetical protein [Mycobacterium sp. DL440]|uniref:hypothetical protein n=1 Tax=Mycobacterium sp. DL440 TaxID=2675523 RepID=UPI00141DB9F6|nr:hypothetical protein [Mycobacterium sp. DL440]